jgi:hypothetical protein
MEYFGSAIFAGCSRVFFLAYIDRFTKNHRPFIVSLHDNICCAYFDDVPFCMTTSVVPILIMSPFVVLLVAIDIFSLCPLPDWREKPILLSTPRAKGKELKIN